jgi:two-component system NtrC family response regulator
MEKLLIIEDDKDIVTQLKWGLSKDYRILTAGDKETAINLIRKEKPNVVALDLGLPPVPDSTEEGFLCLKDILEETPHTKVIVITGNNERESALRAVSIGAYDFYQKPIKMSELKVILRRAFYLHHIEQENKKLQEVISRDSRFEGMIGNCPKMQEIFVTIKKIAASEITILIIGESGTGKELVARAIHQRSLRRDGPFIPINCGGIPDTLIESELFGYEKGSFTDAKTQRIGMIERSHGGTLFLDEIGELPIQLQVKLHRFLQDKKIQRIGGRKEIEIDTRIISATNTDLHKAMKEGKFREDLYYRLGVVNISLPPLREREGDGLLLATTLLQRYANENKRKITGFTPQAIRAIETYHWPGNIRELENRIKRAVIMAEGTKLIPQDLELVSPVSPYAEYEGHDELREAREALERDLIKRALAKNKGNITKAAEKLGVSRPTLYELMEKLGIGKEKH